MKNSIGNTSEFEIQDISKSTIQAGAVLIVDDESIHRILVRSILTNLGFAVFEASDGIEAIEIFKQHKATIRCVLCDVYMPHMDGWETLSHLRRIDPGVPIIMSSGDLSQATATGHYELPLNFLGKPFGTAKLHQAINQALGNNSH